MIANRYRWLAIKLSVAILLAVVFTLPFTGHSQPNPSPAPIPPPELLDRVEGNWEVTATDSPERGKTNRYLLSLRQKRQLTLNGGSFVSGDSFSTTNGANWSYDRVSAPEWLGHSKDAIVYSPSGSFSLTDYWGRVSTFRPTGINEMRGEWRYNNNKGTERWRRLPTRISTIQYEGRTTNRVTYGGSLGRLHVDYDKSDGSRGNKREFSIKIFGENLWGYHYAWVEGKDVEAYWSRPIMGENTGKPDDIIGLELKGYIWSKVAPGVKQIHLDNVTIPFELALEGFPSTEVFTGSRLQQMCQMVSARLVHFYELQARQRTLFNELRQLVRGAREENRSLPDSSPLREAITNWQARTEAFDFSREHARSARTNLDAAESALNRAEAALGVARNTLRLEASTLLPIASGNTRGRLASDLLRDRTVVIENLKANNASPDVIREKEEALRTLQQAIASALGDKQRTRDNALTARNQARTEMHAIDIVDESQPNAAWAAVKKAANEAREQLPENLRGSMPALPTSRTDINAERLANQALQGLLDSTASQETARSTLRRNLEQRLAETDYNDAELHRLGQQISTLRASAVFEAESALKNLGAKEDEPVWEVFNQMRGAIDDTKSAFEPGEGRLDALEKIRSKLTESKEGAELIETAKETLGTTGEVLEFLGTQGERIEKLRELRRELDSPRTALRALSLMLGDTSDAISAVPVLGPTVGRALSIYAQVAGAAGVAVIHFQDKIIERDLGFLTTTVTPERHLYILDEVPASIPSSEHDRVLTMLQVRRLMALIKAQTLEEARNAPYRY